MVLSVAWLLVFCAVQGIRIQNEGINLDKDISYVSQTEFVQFKNAVSSAISQQTIDLLAVLNVMMADTATIKADTATIKADTATIKAEASTFHVATGTALGNANTLATTANARLTDINTELDGHTVIHANAATDTAAMEVLLTAGNANTLAAATYGQQQLMQLTDIEELLDGNTGIKALVTTGNANTLATGSKLTDINGLLTTIDSVLDATAVDTASIKTRIGISTDPDATQSLYHQTKRAAERLSASGHTGMRLAEIKDRLGSGADGVIWSKLDTKLGTGSNTIYSRLGSLLGTGVAPVAGTVNNYLKKLADTVNSAGTQIKVDTS